MARALDGITILDLGNGPACAFATMLLSDHGARVIRLVAPGEPHFRDGGFVVWDRGKECVAFDLDGAAAELAQAASPTPGSKAARFVRLVAGADVLIEDFAPSSPRQQLVRAAWLKQVNPRLVSCSITAYGKAGPWKDEPPIDDLVLARTGVLAGMPGYRPAPVHVVHPLPTVGAALLAAIGVAAALLARERTGRGRSVSTSLMAGALLYHSKIAGERLPAHVFQTHPAGSAPFYSVYRCADDKWVQLGCVHAGFIAAAAKLFSLTALIEEPRFEKGRGGRTPADEMELRQRVADVVATRPLADWARDFEAADVPFAEARHSEDGLADPQVLHNGQVVTLEDPAVGPVVQMGVPVMLGSTPGEVRGPRPAGCLADVALPEAASTSAVESSARAEPDPPPLDGIRILEITNLIAGPTAGRLLADLGADVIKLEPPGGDLSRPIRRTYFYSVNFNKRSIAVDTGTPEGRRVVQAIAARSDALLANLRPHATERMGIGMAVNPRLIETHLTGYGWTGPYSKRPGIDPLAQALMGLERAQGGHDNPPVFPAQLAPTDYTTGAMGTLGTILALFVKQRTGIVQRVDCNLLNGAIVLSSPWFTSYRGRPERPLADKAQYGLGPYHRLYQVSDGWIYVAAATPAEQAGVLAVAGIGETERAALSKVSDKAPSHPNDTALGQALAKAFGVRARDEVLAALSRTGVPAALVANADSAVFLDDPHAAANDMVATRVHPTAGRIRVAWQYVQFADTRSSRGLPTPLLGEHADAVLAEVGMSPAEIGNLRAAGVIVSKASD